MSADYRGLRAPSHIAYALEETNDSIELLGISVPAYAHVGGFGVDGVRITPSDWGRVSLVVHGIAPHGIPALRNADADPSLLESWLMPDVGTDRWDAHTREWHPIETPEQARATWSRLVLRASHQEHRLDAGNVDTALLAEAVRRADRLGWRTLSVSRLVALAAGDEAQLPPSAG